MRQHLILALGFALASGVDAAEAPFETESFSLSPDQATLAVAHGRPYGLVLREGERSRTIALPEIDQVEGTPELALSWSADSNYVALQFVVDEATTAVEVVDASSGKVVWSKAVSGSAWRGEGHELLVVPAHDIGELQDHPGIVGVDVATGQERVFAPDRLFTGRLDARRTVVVAQAVRLVDDEPSFTLEYIDLDADPAAAAAQGP